MCGFQVFLCTITAREFVRTHTVVSPEFLARKFWDVSVESVFFHFLLSCWCNFTLRNTTLVGTCEGQRGAVSSKGHHVQAYEALLTKREGSAHVTLENYLTLETGVMCDQWMTLLHWTTLTLPSGIILLLQCQWDVKGLHMSFKSYEPDVFSPFHWLGLLGGCGCHEPVRTDLVKIASLLWLGLPWQTVRSL